MIAHIAQGYRSFKIDKGFREKQTDNVKFARVYHSSITISVQNAHDRTLLQNQSNNS